MHDDKPTPVPPMAVPLRIRHVDSLRAVAAGLVTWAHLVERLAPLSARDPASLGFLRTLPYTLNVGRMGVMLFFAISGFVICRSFGGPRPGGARRFLIKRFCRLFPAFWVSMLGGMMVWWMTGQTLTWTILAANATMIPSLLNQPSLLGVYWTLEVELFFYAACLGLYLSRGLDRPLALAACGAALTGVPRLLRIADHTTGIHVHLSPGQPTFFLGLAVMFWGAVFRLVYDETGGFRHRPARYRGAAWLLLLTLVLTDVPDPNLKWGLLGLKPGPLSAHVQVVYALMGFALWVACLRVDNFPLTYLGVVSYSLYLFHPVVKYSAAQLLTATGWQPPLWACLAVCAALSAGLAMAAYRWVERPAIALGKRWAGTGRPARPEPSTDAVDIRP